MRARSHGTRNVVALLGVVLAMPLLLAVGVAAVASGGVQPHYVASPTAPDDIPPHLIALYAAAADTCIGLSWTVIAAIAKVETDHGRFADTFMLANGDVRPAIIGMTLDGTHGTAAIPDTDAGTLDRDTVWDHAVGPLQFIPSTWARFGVDANADGTADPHNFHDAVHAAAHYLCASGAAAPGTLRTAILAYNHAGWYADKVLALAHHYGQTTNVISVSGDGYALPVARELLTLDRIRAPHHDYPAWDLPLPIGTPVYAVRGGVVTAVTNDDRCGRGVLVAGSDGAQYTYCHAVAVTVTAGQIIAPGKAVLWSGKSGRSRGPHLHLQIRTPAGTLTCPQPFVEAWYRGHPPDSVSAFRRMACVS